MFSRAMPKRGPAHQGQIPNQNGVHAGWAPMNPELYREIAEEGPIVIPRWQRNIHVYSEVTGLALGSFMGWVAMNQEFKMPDWVRKVIGIGAVGTIAVDGLLLLSYLSRRTPPPYSYEQPQYGPYGGYGPPENPQYRYPQQP